MLRARLLAWFRREKRQLPWRGTRDPYRIWVSEVMLQQTTVAAVSDRYESFLLRFPDVASLARAREESVLAAWSGLGYYARARNLRSAAREIVRLHGGRIPREASALSALPGFGEYMAAAVASIAFGARAPATDANVTRVLSRLFAIAGDVGTRVHARAVRKRAAELLARGRPGDITAALMDLGQLVCTPRNPSCTVCPVAIACAARRRGEVARFPEKRVRPAITRVFVASAIPFREEAALLVRSDRPLLRGLWQFPSAEGATAAVARRRLGTEMARLGFTLDGPIPLGLTQHTIVNRRLEIRIFRATPSRDPKTEIRKAKSKVRWLTPEGLATAAIPTLTRKIAVASGFLPHTAARVPGRHGSRPKKNPSP